MPRLRGSKPLSPASSPFRCLGASMPARTGPLHGSPAPVSPHPDGAQMPASPAVPPCPTWQPQGAISRGHLHADPSAGIAAGLEGAGRAHEGLGEQLGGHGDLRVEATGNSPLQVTGAWPPQAFPSPPSICFILLSRAIDSPVYRKVRGNRSRVWCRGYSRCPLLPTIQMAAMAAAGVSRAFLAKPRAVRPKAGARNVVVAASRPTWYPGAVITQKDGALGAGRLGGGGWAVAELLAVSWQFSASHSKPFGLLQARPPPPGWTAPWSAVSRGETDPLRNRQ